MKASALFISAVFVACLATSQAPQSDPVSITVDLAKPVGSYKPITSWFGYDESNYTTMKYGRQLLGELHDLSPAPGDIRTHHLFTSGNGVPGAQVELVERILAQQRWEASLRLHHHRPDIRRI